MSDPVFTATLPFGVFTHAGFVGCARLSAWGVAFAACMHEFSCSAPSHDFFVKSNISPSLHDQEPPNLTVVALRKTAV